jgi:hypothetical protein
MDNRVECSNAATPESAERRTPAGTRICSMNSSESGDAWLVDPDSLETVGAPFTASGVQLQRSTIDGSGKLLVAVDRVSRLRPWRVNDYAWIGQRSGGDVGRIPLRKCQVSAVTTSSWTKPGAAVVVVPLDSVSLVDRASKVAGAELTAKQWRRHIVEVAQIPRRNDCPRSARPESVESHRSPSTQRAPGHATGAVVRTERNGAHLHNRGRHRHRVGALHKGVTTMKIRSKITSGFLGAVLAAGAIVGGADTTSAASYGVPSATCKANDHYNFYSNTLNTERHVHLRANAWADFDLSGGSETVFYEAELMRHNGSQWVPYYGKKIHGWDSRNLATVGGGFSSVSHPGYYAFRVLYIYAPIGSTQWYYLGQNWSTSCYMR